MRTIDLNTWSHIIRGWPLRDGTVTEVIVEFELVKLDGTTNPHVIELYADEWVKLSPWDEDNIIQDFFEDWREGKVEVLL